MSILKTYDVQCDRCSQWIHGCVTDMAPRDAMVKVRACAQRLGWGRVRTAVDDRHRISIDLCPKCLERHNQREVKQ